MARVAVATGHAVRKRQVELVRRDARSLQRPDDEHDERLIGRGHRPIGDEDRELRSFVVRQRNLCLPEGQMGRWELVCEGQRERGLEAHIPMARRRRA